MPTIRRLRLVVLATGTATMALQMAIVRLLAPAIGTSSVVWATIIGLSLLAMSCGYLLGGRLADRRRSDGRTLALATGIAAALTFTAPLVAPFVLDLAAVSFEGGVATDLLGATIAYALLGFAPALLLGVTPPYAIRLATRSVTESGSIAGSLYASSTIGSIIGTLATALLLVQWIGTHATLWTISAIIMAAAVLAFGARRGERAATDVAADTTAAPPLRPTASAPSLSLLAATLVVVVEGATMMGTEMSIARLVAPFFGASHAVWAIIIATVMGSIALGSRIGGRLADRTPTRAALMTLLASASASVALLPFLAIPVMRLSTGGIDDVAVATLVGTFLATMFLLVAPVTLLGMVPPFVLRLTIPALERTGRTAGRLYACSTIGALVGTFASALWLIPAIGTRRTMLLFAFLLAAIPLAHLVATRRDAVSRTSRWLVLPMLLVGALAFAPTGLVKPLDKARVIDERESRYQFIQVVEEKRGRRILQLNEGWAVHSIWDPESVLTGGIWDHFLVVPTLAADPPCADTSVCATIPDSQRALRMLVIGSAAGTSARAFAELRPKVAMTSVELDREVTAVGRQHFAHDAPVVAADGRPFLARSGEQWNVIHVDAYRQPYIPFHLTTREFFELVREHLMPGGVVSINVGSAPDDQRINEAVAATMRAVFPFVARYRAERYNEVIVASTDDDLTIERARAMLRASDLATGDAGVGHETALRRLFTDFAGDMVDVESDAGRVLTDDRAPVEWMTDRMIFGEAG